MFQVQLLREQETTRSGPSGAGSSIGKNTDTSLNWTLVLLRPSRR